MKDRTSLYPGRTKITYEDGTEEYITIERADEPIEEGMSLSKANLLDDETAARVELVDDPSPNVMFGAIVDRLPVVGEIRTFAGEFDDEHYLLCDGSGYEWTDYGDLAVAAPLLVGATISTTTVGSGSINFRGIATDGSMLVIPCDSGKIYYSTDGASFSSVTAVSTSYDLRSVCYSNGLWVAGGESERLYYSTNGTSWTAGTTSAQATNNDICCIATNGSIWLAVSGHSYVYIHYSTDGKTWTRETTSTTGGATEQKELIDFGPLYYGVLATDGTVLRSTTGSSWSSAATGLTNGYCLKYINGYWYAGGAGTYGLYRSTSSIPQSWSARTAVTSTIYGIATNDDESVIVAVGARGGFYYSTNNGVTFNAGTKNVSTSEDIISVKYCDGVFITAGACYTSVNGIDWAYQGSLSSNVSYTSACMNATLYCVYGSSDSDIVSGAKISLCTPSLVDTSIPSYSYIKALEG